jgi:hypothetical protein
MSREQDELWAQAHAAFESHRRPPLDPDAQAALNRIAASGFEFPLTELDAFYTERAEVGRRGGVRRRGLKAALGGLDDADWRGAVAAAPGAASVRVWEVMSRRRGLRGG